MTDEEYIKAGVELADGWHLNALADADFYHQWGDSQYDFISSPLSDPDQYLLDALAAQLVRQTDAIKRYTINAFGGASVHSNPSSVEGIVNRRGPDRTMNTIKAIVDSGALE